MSFNLCLY